MTVHLIGDNQEILRSLSQHIPKAETKVFSEVSDLIYQLGKAENRKGCLILFDINNPVKDLEQAVKLVKTSFPDINLWAIFDWSSPFLKKELLRMGFKKVLSYRDDLGATIFGDDANT